MATIAPRAWPDTPPTCKDHEHDTAVVRNVEALQALSIKDISGGSRSTSHSTSSSSSSSSSRVVVEI